MIGATVTHRQIERSPLVLERLPALAAMERQVANVRVRTVGTLAGNLCFSDPHSDPATFLLALDAEVESRRGDGSTRGAAAARLPRRPLRAGARARRAGAARPRPRAAGGPLDRAPQVRVPRAARGDRHVRRRASPTARSPTRASRSARSATSPCARARPRRCSWARRRATAGARRRGGRAGRGCPSPVEDANGSAEYKAAARRGAGRPRVPRGRPRRVATDRPSAASHTCICVGLPARVRDQGARCHGSHERLR